MKIKLLVSMDRSKFAGLDEHDRAMRSLIRRYYPWIRKGSIITVDDLGAYYTTKKEERTIVLPKSARSGRPYFMRLPH